MHHNKKKKKTHSLILNVIERHCVCMLRYLTRQSLHFQTKLMLKGCDFQLEPKPYI